MSARLPLASAVVLSASLCAAAWSQPPPRIVAVGDVHATYDGLVEILRETGLVDSEKRWVGGEAILVQTGDLIDRGPRAREVLELMMRLEEEAARAGGRVVSLLGNHELYNLIGYFGGNSTSEEVFRQVVGDFADAKSEKRRDAAYRRWNRWQEQHPSCGVDRREEWVRQHPLGFVEHAEAFSSRGRIGRWLRARAVAERIGDTIFVHGGLSPELTELGMKTLAALNERITLEIAQWDRDRAWLENQGIIPPFATLSEALCGMETELEKRASKSGRPSALTVQLESILDRRPTTSSWLGLAENGPLWFRGFANWEEEEGREEIKRVVEAFEAKHYVVGHTPQRGRVGMRADGAIFLIDTAMVFGEIMDGRPAALEITEDGFHAVYPGKRELLLPATPILEPEPAPALAPAPQASPAPADNDYLTTPRGALLPFGDRPQVRDSASTKAPAGVQSRYHWRDREGNELPFKNADEVGAFLLSAEIRGIEPIPTGTTRPMQVTLEQGGLTLRAAFRHVDDKADRKTLSNGKVVMFFRDAYANEVAAFELATMLGMRSVPPAVLRRVQGQSGSIQLWIENAMTETDRRERDLDPPDPVDFSRQMMDMRVFDNLINNIDRNQGNMLIDEGWNLWLVDHTRSFGRDSKLPSQQTLRRCSRQLWQGLRSLDEDAVTERLGPYLGKFEIRRLLDRRKKVVATLESLIAELGEERVLFD